MSAVECAGPRCQKLTGLGVVLSASQALLKGLLAWLLSRELEARVAAQVSELERVKKLRRFQPRSSPT